MKRCGGGDEIGEVVRARVLGGPDGDGVWGELAVEGGDGEGRVALQNRLAPLSVAIIEVARATRE